MTFEDKFEYLVAHGAQVLFPPPKQCGRRLRYRCIIFKGYQSIDAEANTLFKALEKAFDQALAQNFCRSNVLSIDGRYSKYIQ